MRFCISISVFALCAGLAACGNDNGVGDAGTADAGLCVQPNFTSIYTGILSTNTCAIAGCHATPGPTTGNLGLKGTKDQTHAALLADADWPGQGGKRVLPNDSAASFLYQKISQETPMGTNGRMPTGGKLDDCSITAIKQWIDEGAPNN